MDVPNDDRRSGVSDADLLEQVNIAALAWAKRMTQLEGIDGDCWLVFLGHMELREVVEAMRARPGSAVKRVTLPYLELMLENTQRRG